MLTINKRLTVKALFLAKHKTIQSNMTKPAQ